MPLVLRLALRPLQLKKAEHDHPGEDDQACEIGGSRADPGPPSAAPHAHEQHQVPRHVCSEHQHRKPGGRAGGKEHQGKQCAEQADDAPAENAPEPEGTTKRKAATKELDDRQYLRPPAGAQAKNTARVLAWSQKTQRSSRMPPASPPVMIIGPFAAAQAAADPQPRRSSEKVCSLTEPADARIPAWTASLPKERGSDGLRWADLMTCAGNAISPMFLLC
jgi:hypothetical protein